MIENKTGYCSEIDQYRGTRVLILGGTGFIGLNLAEWLTRAGAEVRIFARRPPPGSPSQGFLQRAMFFPGDIRDSVSLTKAIDGVDVIFNLAGKSGAAASNVEPLLDLEINGRGQLNLLELCRLINPTVSIIFASSRLVYSPSQVLPVSENAALEPVSIYGIHKLLGEHYHLLYARLHGLRTVVLRITNPFGPLQSGNHVYGIVNFFIKTAVAGGTLNVFGDGSQVRDFIHIDDVVRAMLAAGKKAESGSTFNIGGGTAVRFRTMATMITELAGKGSVRFVPWPPGAVAAETEDFMADIQAARRHLAWSPQISFEQGLKKTVEAYAQIEC